MISKTGSSFIIMSIVCSGCTAIDNKIAELIASPSNKTLMAIEESNINEINKNKTNKEVYSIQPINKKQKCTLKYLSSDPKKQDAKLIWDGQCKNGYAVGLGRIIERDTLGNKEQVVEYEDNQKIAYTYWGKDEKSSHTGIIKIDYEKKENEGKARSIYYEYSPDKKDVNVTFFDASYNGNVGYIIRNNPVVPFVEKIKAYTNEDSEEVFAHITSYHPNFTQYEMVRINKNERKNVGYSCAYQTSGQSVTQKLIVNHTGKAPVKTFNVSLPQEYLSHVDNINNKVNQELNSLPKIIEIAEQKKTKYKNKVCGLSSVSFMPIDEYKSICKEDKQISDVLKTLEGTLARKAVQNQQQAELAMKQQVAQAQIQGEIARTRAVQNAANRVASAHESSNSYSVPTYNYNYSIPQMQMPSINFGNTSNNTVMYHKAGNTVFGTDGSRCYKAGNTVVCK